VLYRYYYPHMSKGKVWIHRLLFVCSFVRLRISSPRIKLAASNFAQRVIGIPSSESTFLWTLLSQKPKIGQIGQRAGHAHPHVNITLEMRRLCNQGCSEDGMWAKIVVTKKEGKKKLKTTREWYFTHLPGRPNWGDWFEFWFAESYRWLNHLCQILWQLVRGFRSSDTPNFALLHRNSWSPLQQCKHYRATLWY